MHKGSGDGRETTAPHSPYAPARKPIKVSGCQGAGGNGSCHQLQQKGIQVRMLCHLQGRGCRAHPPAPRLQQLHPPSAAKALSKAAALEVSERGGNEICMEKCPVLPGPQQQLAS